MTEFSEINQNAVDENPEIKGGDSLGSCVYNVHPPLHQNWSNYLNHSCHLAARQGQIQDFFGGEGGKIS